MAEKYPYTVTVDAFKRFMAKLGTVGVPRKVNWKFVQSLGFKSSNHKSFPRILHLLGLIAADGSPTERFAALREGPGGRAKLATFIRDAYSPLFDTFPDADRKDAEALHNFFRAETTAAERTVQAMVGTFQAVCSFASFEAAPAPEEAPDVPVEEQAVRLEKPLRLAPGGLTVNVNIQLELPATTDEDVYERLFSAMERHILKFGEG